MPTATGTSSASSDARGILFVYGGEDVKLYIITKLEDMGFNENGTTIWQNALTHDEKKITFWGSIDSKRNIASISNQDNPFIVEIYGGKYIDKHNRRYGTDISVSEGCRVTVNPTTFSTVMLMLSTENPEQLLKQLEENVTQGDISEECH